MERMLKTGGLLVLDHAKVHIAKRFLASARKTEDYKSFNQAFDIIERCQDEIAKELLPSCPAEHDPTAGIVVEANQSRQ